MNHLHGNPYEELARTHQDPALATLALAWEIRTLTMLEHPWIDHEETLTRLTGNERLKDSPK